MLRLGLVVAIALAAPRNASAGDVEDAVAKMHFEAGRRFYQDGKYHEAAAEFTAGYELTHRSAFLLNLAQTHRRLGDVEKARSLYRTFLVAEPSSPLVPRVQRLLDQLDGKDAQAAPPPEVDAPMPSPVPSLATLPSLPVAPIVAPPLRPRRWVVAWIGLTLTALTLGGGIALEAVAASDYQQLRSSCSPFCSNDQVHGLVVSQDGGAGLLISAGVLAAATVVAFVLEGRRVRAARRP